MKPKIRSSILKNYYIALYGSDVPSSRAFQEATFEEYYTLIKRFYPKISRWKAAMRSRIPEFKKAMENFAPDPDPPPKQVGNNKPIRAIFRRKKVVDLASVDLPDGLQTVLLDRIKQVDNFNVLAEKKRLEYVSSILCGAPDREKPKKVFAVKEMRLIEPQHELMQTMLSAVQPEKLTMEYRDRPVFDLRWLPNKESLTTLWIWAGLIQSIEWLAHLKIESLMLSNVVLDSKLNTTLETLNRLEILQLCNGDPFPPEDLWSIDSIGLLRKLTIPAYPEFKDRWVNFAVTHPDIDFRFPSPDHVVTPKQLIRLLEVYRGVDILSEKRGRTEKFLISINFAGDILKKDWPNYKIADYLKPLASKTKKVLDIHSSSDELTIRSKNIEDCKWAIDMAYEAD